MYSVDENTTLPPLTQEELTLLDTWLQSLKNGLSLFRIHGFLCAILTSPADIPPTEWYPAMLVPDLPDIVSEEEMKLYLDMVTQLKLELRENLSHDEIVCPLIDFRPMPSLSANTLFQDQHPRLKSWCQGYLSGIALRREHWKPLQDFQNLELALQVIANEAQADKLFGIENQGISQSQIQTLVNQTIDSLPVLLGMLYDQACEIADSPKPYHKHKKTDVNILCSQEKTKWQTPCPCPCGKPFAECCTLSREVRH